MARYVEKWGGACLMEDIIAAEFLKGTHINLANLSDEAYEIISKSGIGVKRINLIFRDDVFVEVLDRHPPG